MLKRCCPQGSLLCFFFGLLGHARSKPQCCWGNQRVGLTRKLWVQQRRLQNVAWQRQQVHIHKASLNNIVRIFDQQQINFHSYSGIAPHKSVAQRSTQVKVQCTEQLLLHFAQFVACEVIVAHLQPVGQRWWHALLKWNWSDEKTEDFDWVTPYVVLSRKKKGSTGKKTQFGSFYREAG